MADIITWFATGFGLGKSPILAGTVGALPGLILAWLILKHGRQVQIWCTALLVVVAIPICDVASDTLGGKDDRRIVADEFMVFPAAVVGQAVAKQPGVLAGAFVISRILDGIKPPPAAQAEDVTGGFGIVLDDLIANIYSWILLAVGYAAYRRWHHHRRPPD